jgi:hypothetical protein
VTVTAWSTEPASAAQSWRAIALATLLLVPAVWAVLAGLVALGSDDPVAPAGPALAIAAGLALIPWTFVVLAVASGHPAGRGAAVRATGLFLLVGIPVSALAGDGVTGLVAGLGSGGLVSLRADPSQDRWWRVASVAVAAAYCFALARTTGGAVVVVAPLLPFTGLGLADHLAEWRRPVTE